MTTPVLFFAVLLAFCLVGGTLLVIALVYWYSVGRVVGDFWVKVSAKVIQLVAAYASLRGAYEVAGNKGDWWEPAVAGVVCVVVWEVLEKLIDYRVKAADRASRAELERAEQQGEALAALLTVFRTATLEKVGRPVQAVGRADRTPTATAIRQTLAPDDHLDRLPHRLAVYLSELRPDINGRERNFRNGLYAAKRPPPGEYFTSTPLISGATSGRWSHTTSGR